MKLFKILIITVACLFAAFLIYLCGVVLGPRFSSEHRNRVIGMPPTSVALDSKLQRVFDYYTALSNNDLSLAYTFVAPEWKQNSSQEAFEDLVEQRLSVRQWDGEKSFFRDRDSYYTCILLGSRWTPRSGPDLPIDNGYLVNSLIKFHEKSILNLGGKEIGTALMLDCWVHDLTEDTLVVFPCNSFFMDVPKSTRPVGF